MKSVIGFGSRPGNIQDTNTLATINSEASWNNQSIVLIKMLVKTIVPSIDLSPGLPY
jgi:hypothetical protein